MKELKIEHMPAPGNHKTHPGYSLNITLDGERVPGDVILHILPEGIRVTLVVSSQHMDAYKPIKGEDLVVNTTELKNIMGQLGAIVEVNDPKYYGAHLTLVEDDKETKQ